MTPEDNGNAQALAQLRAKAQTLGIPHYQVKGYDKLYKETMEAQDKMLAESEKPDVTKKAEPKADLFDLPRYYFTDPTTHKIGEYVLLDPKNTIPYTSKGTAYKRLRWM